MYGGSPAYATRQMIRVARIAIAAIGPAPGSAEQRRACHQLSKSPHVNQDDGLTRPQLTHAGASKTRPTSSKRTAGHTHKKPAKDEREEKGQKTWGEAQCDRGVNCSKPTSKWLCGEVKAPRKPGERQQQNGGSADVRPPRSER